MALKTTLPISHKNKKRGFVGHYFTTLTFNMQSRFFLKLHLIFLFEVIQFSLPKNTSHEVLLWNFILRWR